MFDRTGAGAAAEGLPDDIERTRWFLRHILPHEPVLRNWLRRRHKHGVGFDVDDIVQESYAILYERERLDDILNPLAYLFQVARSLVVRNIRRTRVVSIHAVEDLDSVEFADQAATPEENAIERDGLRHLSEVIASMPCQTRQAFVLRRMHGLSQREVAERMGLSENTVEKHIARGIRWLGQWAANDRPPSPNPGRLEPNTRQDNGRTRNQP